MLVVDLQYAFTDPTFSFGGAELIERATVNTARLLQAARAAGVPVFHTVVEWQDEKEHRAVDDQAAALRRDHARLALGAGRRAALGRLATSCCPRSGRRSSTARRCISLLTALQRDTVIVTGCTTSGCVRATTVDAFSYGFRTILPEDCVGDQGRDAHESNLRDVHRRYAEVTNSDEVIAYLGTLRQPATPSRRSSESRA